MVSAKPTQNSTSEKVVARLSLYRRLLNRMHAGGAERIYSHQLAHLVGGTAAQVRRDVMSVGYTGSPTRGYDVLELSEAIGRFLDNPDGQRVALIGVGNLGRAILVYFAARRSSMSIVAAFDKDPFKVNRVINGCRCYPIEEMEKVIAEQNIRVGIVTVPVAEAQAAAEAMVRAGVRGLLNFAPVTLRVGPHVYVEDMDMSVSLEKVSYFAMQKAGGELVAQM